MDPELSLRMGFDPSGEADDSQFVSSAASERPFICCRGRLRSMRLGSRIGASVGRLFISELERRASERVTANHRPSGEVTTFSSDIVRVKAASRRPFALDA